MEGAGHASCISLVFLALHGCDDVIWCMVFVLLSTQTEKFSSLKSLRWYQVYLFVGLLVCVTSNSCQVICDLYTYVWYSSVVLKS